MAAAAFWVSTSQQNRGDAQLLQPGDHSGAFRAYGVRQYGINGQTAIDSEIDHSAALGTIRIGFL